MNSLSIFFIILVSILALFLLSGIVGVLLRALLRQPIRAGSGDTIGFVDGLYFGYVFLRYLLAAHVIGVVAGVLFYMAISPLMKADIPFSTIFNKGVANGVFFLGWVWGPGLALVGAFMHARKLRRREVEKAGRSVTKQSGES